MHHKCQCFTHFGVLMTKKHLFSRLLKKAVSMALWTKASLCAKACPERSRMGSLSEQSLPRTPSRLRIISVNPVILSNFPSCSSCLRGEKIREISVNPWLMNYLHAFGIFTTVESALQIKLFMQNKAKFRKSQMNVNKVLTKDYEKRTLGGVGKTNPKRTQTNPIKANLQNAQMNINKVLTKDYERKLNWALYENEPNTNPNKPNACPPSVWRVRGKK